MKRNTDTQKCLEALQRAGNNGIHSFHLNYIIGTTRCAARINDLKNQGYSITSKYEKIGDSMGVRYFLNADNEHLQQSRPIKPIRYNYKGNVAVPVYK